MISILGYKVIKIILGYHVIFFNYFKDQITEILIFHLIFASDFKTIPFCKYCVFVKDKNGFADNF